MGFLIENKSFTDYRTIKESWISKGMTAPEFSYTRTRILFCAYLLPPDNLPRVLQVLKYLHPEGFVLCVDEYLYIYI